MTTDAQAITPYSGNAMKLPAYRASMKFGVQLT